VTGTENVCERGHLNDSPVKSRSGVVNQLFSATFAGQHTGQYNGMTDCRLHPEPSRRKYRPRENSFPQSYIPGCSAGTNTA
jgi:hypothetical protein